MSTRMSPPTCVITRPASCSPGREHRPSSTYRTGLRNGPGCPRSSDDSSTSWPGEVTRSRRRSRAWSPIRGRHTCPPLRGPDELAVFAASGGVGRSIVAQARERGHDVLALARNPSRVPAGVRTMAADLAAGSPGGLAEALADRDAVLSGLGPSRRADAGIASRGTATIVAAMAACSVRRLVVVSAAPVSDVASAGPLHAPRREGDDVLVGFVLRPIVVRALRP